MTDPPYLRPYRDAAKTHGAGFSTLLWATPARQAARFAAFTRLVDFNDKSLLDVGCGRADLLDFLQSHNINPAAYTGIEAVDELAQAAIARCTGRARIIHADFVTEPHYLSIGAQIIAISGSLNTMHTETFYAILRQAFAAARDSLVFNFLSSPTLAASSHLTWHRPEDVLHFARSLSKNIQSLDDYIEGDCTIAMRT